MTKLVIVDDHAIVRHGLRILLEDMGMDVVGEGVCGQDAIALADQHQPDVMLLDIRMKGDDGLKALPQIKAVSERTAVIILTTYANTEYFAEAIRCGAAGYLLKDSDPSSICDAIEAATRGQLFDPQLLKMMAGSDVSAPSPSPAAMPAAPGDAMMLESLSPRESEVLALMAQGLSNSAIAEALSVSMSTVKSHVNHILQKLDVHDRTQAVVIALQHGLVS
jgi:DNA-binding NarL/FixJ family response regulator